MEKKYGAFGFTIRQKGGNTERTNEEFRKWVESKKGGFCVLEGEGESLHMHGGVYLENRTSKSNFNLQLQRIFERVKKDEDSIKVQRGGTRIMYNKDFRETYLQKDDSRFIYENIPEDEDEYYPSEDEQNAAKCKNVDSVASEYELYIRENHDWVFGETTCENHRHIVASVLGEIWYKERKFKAPKEKRKQKEFTTHMWRWLFPDEIEIDW